MKEKLIDILEKYSGDAVFGKIAQEALSLAKGASAIVRQSSSAGLASFGIARMYRVRMGLEKFRPDCFIGLEQSISSLEADNIDLGLWVVEAEEALVSVWLSSSNSRLVGLVIAKLPLPVGDSLEP